MYGTAGIALTDIAFRSTAGGKSDGVAAGLTVGLGAEYDLVGGWRLRGEGLVSGYGDLDARLGGTSRDIDAGFSTLRLGILKKW